MLKDTDKLVLITGGVRSGKSRFAESLAAGAKGEVAYLAAAEITDGEMENRVRLHRASRPASWLTLEEGYDVQKAVSSLPPHISVLILECLTVWTSNLLLKGFAEDSSAAAQQELDEEILGKVAAACNEMRERGLLAIIVTNEVGCGVVPPTNLGRAFRDLAGRVNQLVASRADAVFFNVSGLPLRVK